MCADVNAVLSTDFGDLIAERIRLHHRAIAERWFARLLALLPVDAREVFPTDSLLDHVPALILEISECLRQPEESIAANTSILEKARELGALRHAQRASLHQVLREYQILNGVLVTFVLEEIERLHITLLASEGARIVSRLHHAVDVLSQETAEAFISLYTRMIREQTNRLEEFTRLAAHEWRQPLGTLQFGLTLLRRPDLDPERRHRTWENVERNLTHLVDLTRKLERVARMQAPQDTPLVQAVSVTSVAREAVRSVRDLADSYGIDVQVAEDLPTITVDVGRLELTLVNLLSNAIKYSDARKTAKHVAVTGGLDGDGWCRLEIRDNGIGMPARALDTIFNRFTRVHAEQAGFEHVPGIGLGLSIVDDSVRAMAGRISVESVEGEGTAFIIRLPVDPAGANRS